MRTTPLGLLRNRERGGLVHLIHSVGFYEPVEERAVLRRDRTLTVAFNVHLTSRLRENATFSWQQASGDGFWPSCRRCAGKFGRGRRVFYLRPAVWFAIDAPAAAEAALAHAASSASTVKAGSILGRALNQGSTQLAGRIQQVAPAQVQAHGSQGSRQLSAQANSGTVPTGAPGGSSLIVSVKGSEPACAASAQAAQEKTTAGTANPNCTGKAAPKTKSQTQYKSAVTLSFPK